MESFLKSGKLGPSSSRLEKSTKPNDSPGIKVSRKGPVPWVEKYRPKTVDDVAQQDEVVAVLKKCIKGADLPHLLFYGPPGTGKTSTILAVARQLFGEIYKERILELNASDERGIQVIRDKVKRFAQFTASGVRPDGKPCPPYKLIILDEADALTSAAQAALRRTMEKETRTTRFCLLCNYVSRIIEPLASRCAKFRFKPLSREILQVRLESICKEENVTVGNLDILIDTSGGDLRKAITYLQSVSRLQGASGDGTLVDKTELFNITGVIPDEMINSYIEACKSGHYEKVETQVDSILNEGFSVGQIFEQLFNYVIISDLTDKQKALISEKLAVCDFRLMDGASEYLQFMDASCAIIKALNDSS